MFPVLSETKKKKQQKKRKSNINFDTVRSYGRNVTWFFSHSQ